MEALGDFFAGSSKPVLKRLESRWPMLPVARSTSRRHGSATSSRRPDARSRARRWSSSQPERLDVVGLAEDDLEAAFQVFTVRGGRVLGRKGWIVDRVEDLDRPELVASFLRQLYMEREDVPPRILVPTSRLTARCSRPGCRTDAALSRDRGPGSRRETQAHGSRGSNATDAFHRHKLRRASDFGARSRALSELADQLGLEQAPLRIECYDISNLGPSDTVGSMVVFEDGLPSDPTIAGSRSRSVPGQDDFASMEEMLTRRFSRLLKEKDEAPGGRRRFSYPPALVVVDGGGGS